MKSNTKKLVADAVLCALGSFICAVAITVFIKPNMLSPGGITGISVLINHFTGISTGSILLIINIPIIIAGYLVLGFKLIAKSGVVTLMLSLSLDLAEAVLPQHKTDLFIACIFGGMLMGLGLGIVFLRGATTGGTDILAKIASAKLGGISIGRSILIIDAAVIAISAAVYKNIDSALYSAVSLFVSSKTIDLILCGADSAKTVFIFTRLPDFVCGRVTKELGRGITKIAAKGGYSGNDNVLLFCTVRRSELHSLLRLVSECDKEAFTVVSDASEVIGKGFKYLN